MTDRSLKGIVAVVEFGIDQLRPGGAVALRLQGARVGVLSHAAAVDRSLTHLLARLSALDIMPKVLFGPEHGFDAAAQDMEVVSDGQDDALGLRVVSLYGDDPKDLVPSAEDLSDLDVLVIDLCDVGARYYTFVWTALLATRAAAAVGTHCLILDRPNPLGGLAETSEGKFQQKGYTSFVGWERVPIRHSLTVGELVALFAEQDGLLLGRDGALSVAPVTDLPRAAIAPDWDRPFVLPSPNMPTYDTARVYPGGCLLEGTNLSEGRGHTRPFEFLGAPWLNADKLASAARALDMPGVVCRPTTFVPMFHKHAGKPCGGVQVHVTGAGFQPVATYVALIALCHHQAPADFAFRTEKYEFIDDIPAFDLLTGSPDARQAIDAGTDPLEVARMVAPADPAWREMHARAVRAAQSAQL